MSTCTSSISMYSISYIYIHILYFICNSESLVHRRFGSVRIEWNRNGIGTFLNCQGLLAAQVKFSLSTTEDGRKEGAKWHIQTGTTLIALTVSGVAIASNDPGGITGEHLEISLDAQSYLEDVTIQVDVAS